MNILKPFLLGLVLGNTALLQAKKPVTLRILIADEARLNVLVKWSNQSDNTNANGEVTIEKKWYQKRSKGKKIKLTILWNGRDSKLTYHAKDTIIVLDAPVTVIDCKFEPLRKLEADAKEMRERIKWANQRNHALLADMKTLELRLSKHLRSHQESLMSHYNQWLDTQIAAMKNNLAKQAEQTKNLDDLIQHLFDNDVLEPEVKKELNQADDLQKKMNPQIQQIEKTLPEIYINLDNEPDQDLTSDILFDPGKDSLKIAAQTVLADYATKKLRQVETMFAKEVGQPRERVCILSFTGYADAAAMTDVTLNSHCPPPYQDATDGNLCLSWRRANSVKVKVVPLFTKIIAVKDELPVGKGREYALKDPNQDKENQDKWRKCSISVIYMSKSFYDTYVNVIQVNTK
jgi:outer membrane protein OmpA-like peptidoglycan-associated protein